MARQILLVDDDALLRRSLAFTLEHAGYRVQTAGSAEDGLLLAAKDPPELILLDIGLPGMDGLAALREFQARYSSPMIFLTARQRDLDQIVGLQLGADDYIGKPFNPDVLLARVKNALRRYQRPATAPVVPTALVAGDLSIDPATRSARLNDRELDLPPRAFDLLYALAGRAGQVVSINELLSHVRGPEYLGKSQVVYVHMRWLREKLESDLNRTRRLITVHGQGYKLVAQEPPEGGKR